MNTSDNSEQINMVYISKQELIEGRAERWMNATIEVRKASGIDAQNPSFVVGESSTQGTYFIKVFLRYQQT